MSRSLLLLMMFSCFLCVEETYAQEKDSVQVEMNVDSISVQVPDSLQSDSLAVAISDSLQPLEPTFEKIFPFEKEDRIGFQAIRDDSLLRWEIWPNWGEFNAYRHDAISFRQGSTGRIDAFDISGYGAYEQQIYMDGIDISNPVTGLVNYNFIPANKIEFVSERFGSFYTSEIQLKNYYLTKPLSYLNFDEANYNYRNLEFMVAQNFSERTNMEISFWDRRDGGNISANDVQGNQILFKGYHYLKENLQLRSTIIRNEISREEPFGYEIGDINTFDFDEFTTSANLNNAQSETLRRDFIVGLYQRSDSLAAEDAGITLSQTRNKFDLPNEVDTLFWEVSTFNLNAFKRIRGSGWNARISTDASYNDTDRSRNFSRDSWGALGVRPEFEYSVSPKLVFYGHSGFEFRSTSHQEFDVTLGSNISVSEALKLSISGSLFSEMPTIQHLYWDSKNYSGTESLDNRTGISFYGKADFQVSEKLKFGISGRYSFIENDFFLGGDSTFVNGTEYQTTSASLYGSFNNHLFDLESSVTASGFLTTNASSLVEVSNTPEEKIWIRNNAFVKGYLYNRATYVKAGIKTVLSPLPYYSQRFNTELQFWEDAAADIQEIPAFFRADVELSARLRGMMILMRWENVLDGYGQAGYFESASLPMPGRRLILGIRAQFRN